MAFAKHVFGDDAEAKPDYDFIPSAVFSSPPIANVGLSEEQAVEKYKNVDVFTSSYKCALPCLHKNCALACSIAGNLIAVPSLATVMQHVERCIEWGHAPAVGVLQSFFQIALLQPCI